MCLSLRRNPKCRVCISISLLILAIFMVVSLILAIHKLIFFKDIIKAVVMSELLGMFIEFTKMNNVILNIVFQLIFMVGSSTIILYFMPELIYFLFLKCCPNSCCPKFLAYFTFLFSVIVIVIILILEIFFSGIETVFSKEEVERQCNLWRWTGQYE